MKVQLKLLILLNKKQILTHKIDLISRGIFQKKQKKMRKNLIIIIKNKNHRMMRLIIKKYSTQHTIKLKLMNI